MKCAFSVSIFLLILFSCREPTNEMEDKIELPQFAENCPTFDDGLEYLERTELDGTGGSGEYNDSLAQPGYGPYFFDGRSNLDRAQINASIIRPDLSSNELKWNDTLINVSRLTIFYESISDSTRYSFDVTGKDSHILSTGKAIDDMRIWNVKLIAEFEKKGTTIFNNKLRNQHFKCSE